MPAMPIPEFTLRDLAAAVEATVDGDATVTVRRVDTLDNAGPDAITFFTDARHRAKLATTRAAAVIVAPEFVAATALPKLVHRNPYLTYARVVTLLNPPPVTVPGIAPSACIDPSARVDATASIGPYVVIGARAVVGARAVIGAGANVGADVELGADVHLHPHVVIYQRCIVGDRTVLFAGAVIGADGFGMADDDGRWVKIPQVGRVVIGVDCEIGANTTIDRGALDDTVIEEGVKIDNQVQVGHNCRIGAHSAIAGCVGIAGSTMIGKHCRLGGAAMIAGHLSIVDGTTISAGTLVASNIDVPGAYTGTYPTLPYREWRYVATEVRRLRQLVARVGALEKQSGAPAAEPGEAS